jgi:prepilin-type processing-associated H-X9-DG protein
MIFVPFWRRGYAREACARVLAHLFEDYHGGQVAAEVDTRNAASMRLVEALGFTRVATTPGADFFKGSASDEYRYELSATAFTSMSESTVAHSSQWGNVAFVDGRIVRHALATPPEQ